MLCILPPLPLDHTAGFFIHAAGLPAEHTLDLRVRQRQARIPQNLFPCFIQTPDHAQLQAPAGPRTGGAIVQTHHVHRPAADVHQQEGRLARDEIRIHRQSGISLRVQPNAFHRHLIRLSLIPVFHRLGRAQQIFFKTALLPSVARQRQAGRQSYGTSVRQTPPFQLPGDGCQRQQVIGVVRHLFPLYRLAARPAHVPFPLVLQHILPGVGFVVVCREARGEHTVGGFDGRIAVVDPDDRFFVRLHRSFRTGPGGSLSFPAGNIYPGWGSGGGGKRSTPRFPGAPVPLLTPVKGYTSPWACAV